MRLFTFVLGLLEAPSRVRLLESEVAYLRRHVGVLMRAKEAEEADEMERRMTRGLEEARVAQGGGRSSTRLTATQAASDGGRP